VLTGARNGTFPRHRSTVYTLDEDALTRYERRVFVR
jgi:hypothetical protein